MGEGARVVSVAVSQSEEDSEKLKRRYSERTQIVFDGGGYSSGIVSTTKEQTAVVHVAGATHSWPTFLFSFISILCQGTAIPCCV